jgi:hypothetical protein
MAEPTQAEIDAYYNDLYQGKGGHISKTDVAKVQKQILSQGLTSKWKGQGFGSAEANALDMAKSLVASGVTDIKQLGQGTYYAPQAVTERLVNAGGQPVQQNGGKYYVEVPDYNTGNFSLQEVDPKEVTKQVGITTTESNGDYGSNDVFTPLTAEQQKQVKTDATGQRTVPIAQGQGIINKDTGERILSNYNERTQGNAFGGTYAGKGNTAYRVQFDAKGNPIFYTTEASSNTLLNILQSNPVLNMAANAAAAYFGGPLGTMALQAAEGKDAGDILKAGALSWAGGQAGAYLSGSESLVDVLGQTGANIAANAAKSFVTSEGRIDPVAALLAGGMDAGVGAIIGNIPGFEGLDKGTQTLVTKTISNTLRTGKLDPASLVQAAFKAGTSAMANATNTPTEAEFNAANTEFLKTLEPYLYTDQNTYPADTKGNVTNDGKFEPDPMGSTTYGQMNPNVSGNVGNMKDWSFDQETGQWTREDPETGLRVEYQYKTPITGTAQTGADIMGNAGAGSTTSTAGTRTAAPAAKSPAGATSGSSTADAGATAAPTVSRVGLDPLDVLRMKNDVAQINPLEELFGGSIYDHKPASSAKKETAPEADIVKALEDTQGAQDYSGGGDIHALLQLLRS